ncbi:MAG: ABC transporter permease [Anaerolineales bacterium]|nr:MAG: ABC transporter permease [Anaerolineales bacterium]
MRVLDIALKDLLRNLRNGTMVFIMFLLPLLTNGLMYFAFGGMAGGDDGFDLQVTQVQVVNLDEAAAAYGGFSAGQMLVEFLQDETLADLIEVTTAADEQSARTAVDQQEAGVAVIIPAGFTSAALVPEGAAAVTLYADPTLTLGPAVVEGIVRQFVDGFAGAGIAAQVVAAQLGERGLIADTMLLGQAGAQYGVWAAAVGEEFADGGLLDLAAPPGEAESTDFLAETLGAVVIGMLIFYAFLTSAHSAQSIIVEDEEGTLARLFTTSTPRPVVLGGKLVSVFVTVIVQVLVSMLMAGLVFGVSWGQPVPTALAVVGLVAAAAGFGVLIMSPLKSTRQAGPVLGVVISVSGMAGGLYTTGFPNLPRVFDTVALFTPQGWALRAWNLAQAGGAALEVLVPAGVALGFGVAAFIAGALVFRRRFA